LADTLGWTLLEDRIESLPPEKALEVAQAILPALSGDDEIRSASADLYRKVHGEKEHFETIMDAAGLEGNQSPRRAVQTLDTCLAIGPGSYVVNRYDNDAWRVEGFNDVLQEYELVDHRGRESSLECKLLADEYDPADPQDFRVISRFDREGFETLLQKDPEGALRGICLARGGSISQPELKELLVDAFLDSKKWSSWWGRARTAIKKSDVLTVEGRPAVVEYHPGGRTLEEELAPAIDDAILPEDYFEILRTYVRETQQRSVPVDEAFAGKILETLARMADEYRSNRPADALTAALSLDAAEQMGLTLPEGEYPRGADVLRETPAPAASVANVPSSDLWPAAMRALDQLDNAADQFEALLTLMPASQLDAIAERLRTAGREDTIKRAAAECILDVADNLEICLWLWKGPDTDVPNAPEPLDLLSRFLAVMQELHREHDVDNDFRRDACQKIRNALTESGCRRFLEALEQMDEGVARTIKRRIERSPGLSVSTREELLQLIREKYYKLFLKEKVDPWLDESVVYLTEESLAKKEAELKELTEERIPANSKAIGAAADLGDLSENGEWQYAIEERRRLLGQVASLQDDLARARIIEPRDIPTDYVGIGSRVTVKPVDGGEPIDLTFMGPWETDVDARVYSYKTPVAQSLMGLAVGDTATLKIGGVEGEYLVEGISPGLTEQRTQ
jgi:transcription elongation factor GreA